MSATITAPIQSAATCAQSLEHLRASGLVRLDDAESTALAAALDGVPAYSVEVFGSRTDRAGRGGDIDLLILSDAPRFATARQVSTRFFMQCEERIDILVLDPDHLAPAETAFLQSLKRVTIA